MRRISTPSRWASRSILTRFSPEMPMSSTVKRACGLCHTAEAISTIRAQAEAGEVRVECHQSELADLGFATSGSVDLVIAAHTLDDVDDLPRLLRQVHRVLRPDAGFVMSITHPVAAMFDPGVSAPARPYGSTVRSIAELFAGYERSNFRVDVVHELGPVGVRRPMVPQMLVVRARKLGV